MNASIAGLGLLLGSAPARAHDLWLSRDAGAFVLRYGHHGGQSMPLDAGKIKALSCRDHQGVVRNVMKAAKVTSAELRYAGACASISAFYDGGAWSLTPDGEKNLPKDRVPDAVKSWRSRQFAKWIDTRSPAAAKAAGDELEIVPVTDLAKARSGDKATFRVLLDGRPLPGATLAIDHKPLGETDDEGTARIKIRASDIESVSATYRRPIKSTEADSEVLEASLTFEVAR